MMILTILTGALLLFLAEIIHPHPQDLHTMYTWMNLGFERGIFQIYQMDSPGDFKSFSRIFT